MISSVEILNMLGFWTICFIPLVIIGIINARKRKNEPPKCTCSGFVHFEEETGDIVLPSDGCSIHNPYYQNYLEYKKQKNKK